MIPEDWDYGVLDQFWTVTDCKHVTAPFIQSGFPLASIRETQSRIVDLSEANQTTEAFYRKMIEGGRKPNPGDLIFSRNATVGEVAQVTDKHPLFAMGQDVCLLKKRREGYSTDFLQSFLKSSFAIRQIEDAMVGSTFKRVNVAQIKSLLVVMPDPSEQRAIAAALADADALIAALEGMIAKKRDLKQAAMQHLLTGKTRLPGFSGEWEVKRLGDHVRFLKNGTLSRAQLSIDAPVKYLHYGDIHGSTSLWLRPKSAGMPCVDPELVASLDRLEDGDLIFADASEDLDGVGKSIEITDCIETEVVSGLHTIAARFDKEVLADGFKAYLQFMPPFRDHLRSMAAGTKVLATNRKHIGSATLALPEPPEQTAIAEVLSDMDADLAALEAQAAKARAVKQGMMQELLTGRVRLV